MSGTYGFYGDLPEPEVVHDARVESLLGAPSSRVTVLGTHHGVNGTHMTVAAHHELIRDMERRKDEQVQATVARATEDTRRKLIDATGQITNLEREVRRLGEENRRLSEMQQAASGAYDALYARCEAAECEVLDLRGRLRQAEAERDQAFATAEAISLAQSL